MRKSGTSGWRPRARGGAARGDGAGVDPSSLLGRLLALPVGFVEQHGPASYPRHRARDEPRTDPRARRPAPVTTRAPRTRGGPS